MPNPKLKVGDTFIYTKEMNDAKQKTDCDKDFESSIGNRMRVLRIGRNGCGPSYELEFLPTGIFHVDVIDPFLRDRDEIREGDILVRDTGDESEVLGICGKVYFLGKGPGRVWGCPFTLEELTLSGYKLKPQEESVKEMTVADVEKLAGCKVKIIK